MAMTLHGDHVGSLLRPPELLAARKAHNEGRLSDEALREAEDTAILKALDMQKQAGVEVFTDGEYRRGIWYGPIGYAIEEALVPVSSPDRTLTGTGWQGRGAELANQMMHEVGGSDLAVGKKIPQDRRLTGHESGFLRQHAPGPWKMTMPGIMHRAPSFFREGVTDAVYQNVEALVDELVGLVQKEIRALVAEGCSYIQLDSLLYVIQMNSPRRRQALIDAGHDPDAYMDYVIDVDNACLNAAKELGVTVGLHMCRGNNRSAWATEGSYEVCAEKAFQRLNVDRFLLEYDTDRAGGFEPLRFMPAGKTVVLGLISSKEPQLESVDDLLRRIDEASKYVAMENLAISPQCGFASTYEGNLLSWDDQQRKLELVMEVARRAWG